MKVYVESANPEIYAFGMFFSGIGKVGFRRLKVGQVFEIQMQNSWFNRIALSACKDISFEQRGRSNETMIQLIGTCLSNIYDIIFCLTDSQ